MITGTHASIGPFCTPSTLANQPSWKTATVTPSAAPIVSRFMIAAWIGITIERKMTKQQQRREQDHDREEQRQLAAEHVREVDRGGGEPADQDRHAGLRSNAGSTSSRRWLTRLVVATACGAESG